MNWKKVVPVVGLMATLGFTTAYADDVTVSSSDVTAKSGETAVISVNLTNTVDITAYQMSIAFPEGISIESTVNKKGKTVYSVEVPEERIDDHTISVGVKNNVYTLACFSATNATFYENSGSVCDITVKVDETVKAGTYDITFSNLEFTTPKTVAYNPEGFTIKLTVKPKEETATMNITEAGWATFCAPFEITELPENVKAYTAAMSEDNTWVKLTEQNLPIEAGTPLVLAGPVCTKEYTAVPTYTGSTTPQKGCLTGNLTGALADVEENKDNYLLQNQKLNGVGWYLVESDGLQIGANRCYMTKNSTTTDAREFYGMSFDGETTTLEQLWNNSGTTLEHKDGKYLVNGKIVIVKSGKAYNMNGQNIK